jgi:hypothetical protein
MGGGSAMRIRIESDFESVVKEIVNHFKQNYN